MTDIVVGYFRKCNLPSLFLMKIKYEISEHQLNKEADPIMTRKVLCHFHIIIKENF